MSLHEVLSEFSDNKMDVNILEQNENHNSLQEKRMKEFRDTSNQIQTESGKLKLNFLQRALQRVKDQNTRLLLRIQKVESQNQELKLQRKSFEDSLNKQAQQLKRKDKEIQSLSQKLEVRTRRHESELSQNISKSEKEEIERKIRRAEENAAIYKIEKEAHLEKISNLLHELQSQKRQKTSLLAKIDYLHSQMIKDGQKITELEALYQQKMAILQTQKMQLAKQNESLSLQLKLFERRKQIQGLLDYQNKIGKDSADIPTQRTFGRSILQRQGEYECCAQLQQQLWQAEQLITLLKQRNTRLCGEVESIKKRCAVLQGIICSSTC